MSYAEEEFTEKIQRFLSGDMTESEREAFETLMEKDELLRDEVDFQRGLTQFLHDGFQRFALGQCQANLAVTRQVSSTGQDQITHACQSHQGLRTATKSDAETALQ